MNVKLKANKHINRYFGLTAKDETIAFDNVDHFTRGFLSEIKEEHGAIVADRAQDMFYDFLIRISNGRDFTVPSVRRALISTFEEMKEIQSN